MWREFPKGGFKDNKKRKIIAALLVMIAVLTSSSAVLKLFSEREKPVETALVSETETAALPEIETEAEEETEEKPEEETQEAEQEKETLIVANSETERKESVINDADSSEKPDLYEKIKGIVEGDGKTNTADKKQDAQENNDNSGDEDGKEYVVNFHTQGGNDIASRNVKSGTKISSLPTPYRDGYIFVCWYYDENGTNLAKGDDTVNSDVALYADYAAQDELEGIENITFASATDVSGDSFTITVVTEDKTLDADTVRAGMEAKNLTDPTQKSDEIIEVSGADGSFVISGKNPAGDGDISGEKKGFADGCTYQITLTDTRLNFEGEAQTAREYNFTTDKEQVINVALKSDITYVPVGDLSNIINDGVQVDTLSVALYQADKNGKLGPAQLTKGSFEYANGSLQVGDTVSVYAGLRPDLRTLDTPKEENGDIAYVKITAKDGNVYSYENASPEDVIFEPDMLPVSVAADMDDNAATITVDNEVLDYSDDVYSNIELDSQTTVDVGDFLVFYTGTFGVESGSDAAQLESYARITDITENDNNTTTIGYETVGWEEVLQTMDIYTKQQMSGADMVEGVDTEAIEAAIEQQAIDSGFAEEAAQYLGSLALATDNFTKLSDNMNLEDYKVTLEDETPVSMEELQLMASGITAECELEDGYPKAKISTHPQHFNDVAGSAARDKGLSIELEVKANITIGKKGSDNQLVITVSGKFTEEVGLDLGVRSKAVWKVWGIFPYIAEYRVTANIDVLNYTGIEVNAIMVTKEGKGNEENSSEALDIADQIKELLADSNEGEDEDKDESSSKLVKRYSEMLDTESDWIRVIEQNIVDNEQQIPPALPIIAVDIEVNFVVNMDACISVGFDFEYMSGKRYTYTIDVFAGKVYNDTVSLWEETYEFDFYAMGRLAVKAGLEFEFKVGLFSTDLDSVGFRAEAGAYTKLWGYFYYELKYTESRGRSQKYNGALLINVGAYLDVGLEAQALGGRYSTELTLYDNEWLLWSVGKQDNILDFATAQEDMPQVVLKQHVRSAVIPDSVFSMHYLDLKDGDEKQAVYNDYYDETKGSSDTNRRNFDIRMTNDKFSYDPQTNTISVNPDAGDKKLEGEMIITWIQYPLAFSSRPIQRTISLYWDNLRDGYVIVPYTNGGSYINIINEKYEAKVTQPKDLVKMGYIFAGWFLDEELTVPYEFPETMPAEDANIYAKWTECTDTPYRVEHYKEQTVSGEYELSESETLTGTTGSYVTCEVKQYDGYNAPSAQQLKIEADGSAVLRYYYSLQWHKVTFSPGEVSGENITFDLKYGAKVTAPKLAVKGYSFTGWDKEVASIMGTEDVTYTAQWSKNSDTEYRIECYVQDVDGSYHLAHYVQEIGFTDAELSQESLRNAKIDGDKSAEESFGIENGIVFDKMTEHGILCDTVKIRGDGSTVVKLYYKRLSYKAVFDFGYDGKKVEKDAYYGAKITAPEQISRKGYEFAGWSIDGITVVEPQENMEKSDITYYAVWIPNTYTVKFDKNNENASGSMQKMSFVYDEEQTLTANSFTLTGYRFVGWSTQKGGKAVYSEDAVVKNLTAEKNKEVTLYAVWTPEEYILTYEGADETGNLNPETYTVENEFTFTAPVKTGYVFAGWFDNAALSGNAVTGLKKGTVGDKTFYAKWEAATDTAYKVEHYKADLNGGFVLADTDYLTGTTDTQVTPGTKEYEGFMAPEVQNTVIFADGSTVVRYEYTRKSYTITLDAAGGTLSGDNVITAKYEEAVTLPSPVKDGYGFDGWYLGDTKYTQAAMPAENLNLTAKWEAGKYSYTVNHYRQNLDGTTYTLAQSVVQTADMDSEVTPEPSSFEGFSAPEETKTIVIGSDASANVVEYYYTRNKYRLSWDFADARAENYTDGEVYYETPITAPIPVKTGYSYSWNEEPLTVMPARDVSYAAVFMPNEYTIAFELNGGVTEGEVSTRQVTYDAPYGELPVLTRDGYIFDGWFTSEDVSVTADTVVKLAENHKLYAHFTPVNYTITYEGADGATNSNPKQYNVETGTIVLVDLEKTGYTFEGFYETEDYSGEAVTEIMAGSMEDKTLYAKWRENSYNVVFHANNGTADTAFESFSYTESRELSANEFEKPGYRFSGWAVEIDGAVCYEDGAKVRALVAEDGGELHLYAVWEIVTYQITYKNLDGAENAEDNPTSFTAQNNVIALHDPKEKTGYTFEGWYTDAEFKNRVSGAITLNTYYDWIFYAKWNANPYIITFDSCLGDAVSTETMVMTYDKEKNLTLLSEMTNFVKPGYSFAGWAVEKGGNVVYRDGEKVKNLAASGNVNLYAVWELNVFTISYDLGAGGIGNTNPAQYSIEDNDVKLTAPQAKDGYQFLGWYEGDVLVTEIVRGTQKDYKLTAKWGCGGTFNLSFEGEETVQLLDGSAGKKLTYKVTRTLPEGTVATPNPLYVYYRTVNGTAYGSTVGIDVAQDKYHFKHAGGENVYLTFGANDMEQTFVVEEWDAETSADVAATFQTNNTERYYNVELYKTVNTTGGPSGTIGEDKSLKRIIPGTEKYQVTADMYNQWFSYTETSQFNVSSSSYKEDKTKTYYSMYDMINNQVTFVDKKNYMLRTVTNAQFYMTLNIKEVHDGYFWLRLGASSSSKFYYICEYVMDTGNKDWKYNLTFPYTGNKQVDTEFKWKKGGYNYNMVVSGSPTYARIGADERIRAEGRATGSGSNEWTFGAANLYYKPIDAKAPQQVGISSLALTKYKAGEQISITVIYNEVIASAENLQLGEIAGLPIRDAVYVAGAGTNALTFTATVTEDFEVTPDVNNAIKNLKPVSGTVKDIFGN